MRRKSIFADRIELNVLMIDQISKLKDHVNVSIMKAVQVDESEDTLCSLGESLYSEFIRTAINWRT